jgi:mannose-6-phosphate isomerase-like protein (cupin superfamily)
MVVDGRARHGHDGVDDAENWSALPGVIRSSSLFQSRGKLHGREAPMSEPPCRFAAAAARAAPLQAGRASALLLAHGSLELRWYAPRGVDAQTPHTRDEVYVVASGAGWFVRGGERVAFSAGDALFVRAGVAHRFEDFSEDFATWVMFYGPEGGE